MIGKLLICLFAAAGALSAREVISLDGEWEIAEGYMNAMPAEFNRKAPVPGLADMAKPAFLAVGGNMPQNIVWEYRKVADPLREAFWYRRTFNVETDLPDTAMLRVLKACYTTRVYINGQFAGDHYPSFTPGQFEIRRFLRKGENTIVIRVGASPAQIPVQYATGHDFEKAKYIPGIYDSVELILSGGNYIDHAQIAPDLEKGGIRVAGEIYNWTLSSQEAAKVPIKLTVSERLSGKVVAQKEIESPETLWFTRENFKTFIKIPGFKTWSPESPFLYNLTIETPNDKWVSRFGMRSFRGDKDSVPFILNGKPYYLRGTNVTFFRFAEDPQRGSLPWNWEWVRKLHKSFKANNWNSMRYCIGFPPEKWYEIADEEGLLIQDEFPVWTSVLRDFSNFQPEILAMEYMEWLRAHANYPSVVIWDAQNESAHIPQTARAAEMVRGYDLSNRPWDNGWETKMRPGDSSEMHPYRAWRVVNGRYRFPQDLEAETGAPERDNEFSGGQWTNPAIINEYSSLWLNRDGTPTTITKDVYAKLCGPDASADALRLAEARYTALLTEMWRGHRKIGAVLHFCSLGYSRPDGQTSDNFIDVPNLVYNPVFMEYVPDSFSPVMLFPKYFEKELKAGAAEQIEVACINDLYEDFEGKMKVEVKSLDGNVLHEASYGVKIPATGSSAVGVEIPVPAQAGKYDMHFTLYGSDGNRVTRSVRWLNAQ